MARKALGQPIKPSDLIAAADVVAAAFFRKQLQRYVLVTSLSMTDLPAKQIVVRGCTISSLKERGTRFPLPNVLTSGVHKFAFSKHLTDTKYRLVKVAAGGRTTHDATETALDALNLLRALWSLYATYGSWTQHFGSPEKRPLGVIHLGPVHTLHFPDGRPAEDNLYWYTPEFTRAQALFDDSVKWPQIEKRRRWAMRRLGTLPYRRELEDLLVRFIVALDQPEPNTAF